MKWALDTFEGIKIWYSKDVIDKIKQIAQDTINKRPHSDNTQFEKILKIIQEEDMPKNIDCTNCIYFELEGIEGVCKHFGMVIQDPEPESCSAYTEEDGE